MAVNVPNATKVYFCSLFNQFKSPCCLCGQSTLTISGFCQGCLNDLPRLSGPLCRCALPLEDNIEPTDADDLAPLCSRCLDRSPAYLGIQAPMLYCQPLSRLVNGWKHHGRLHLQQPLQHLLVSQLCTLPEVDLVVPIPLHWRRQWRRGFNQTALLANALADRAKLPFADVLRRPSAQHHQQGSNANQRRSAMRGSFVSKARLDGLRILLIDDVVTTGSTVGAASQALLESGAHSVSVAALCRVLPPDITGDDSDHC
ncbi:ComF family protein [Alcanivorax sp. 1008]|uniref:ComF family protein n=1 Tax=Alcanivorax sp. 1008 TaxID=2816853 RepID=UPI001D2F4FE0|nr:ComF family protein [Alcanivorax sp. 1008]MCC1498146.1 ComF family protein [Alcanivorax sp. 1008]